MSGIYPRIPVNVIEGEDKSVPRICTSTSLDGCLTGIGPNVIGINCLLDIMDQNKSFKLSKPVDIVLPFTVIKFEVNKNSPDVWLSGKVAKHGVVDAFYSDECWITKPTVPCEVMHLWLTDGKVINHNLLFNGEKYLYSLISNSQWSNKEQPVNTEFLFEIFDNTKAWLKQGNEIPKSNSLNEKIAAAEYQKNNNDCSFSYVKGKEHLLVK